MAFSSSFQYGGYYSFFSKQDFKQFAASWISKPRKRQMSSFFSPLFGFLLCWLHQESEGLLSKFRWGCMGTRHLNLLFFLSEGENPFPFQPFLKRNFDLLNPEARVSFPLRHVWALEPFLWRGDCRPPNRPRCSPRSATRLPQLPPRCRVASRVFSTVTLTSLRHHLILNSTCWSKCFLFPHTFLEKLVS